MFCCFKQKTAYEWRISDWSSYVCSSDLIGKAHGLVLDYDMLLSSSEHAPALPALFDNDRAMIGYTSGTTGKPKGVILNQKNVYVATVYNALAREFGRESCRAKVCQYV